MTYGWKENYTHKGYFELNEDENTKTKVSGIYPKWLEVYLYLFIALHYIGKEEGSQIKI